LLLASDSVMSSCARQLPAELIQGANVTGAQSRSSEGSAAASSWIFAPATPLQPMDHLVIEGSLARESSSSLV